MASAVNFRASGLRVFIRGICMQLRKFRSSARKN